MLGFLKGNRISMVRQAELLRQREEEDEELGDLGESLGFNVQLAADRKKLVKIARHLDASGEFAIVKLLSSSNGNRRQIKVAFVDYPPAYTDIVELCEERHGGGTYGWTCHPDSHIMKRFHLEGESRTPEVASSNNGNKPSSKLEDVIESNLTAELQNNPELMSAAMVGLLEKRLRVKLGGGDKATDPIQALIDTAEQLRDLQGVLSGGGDSWKAVIADIGKSLGQPIVDLLKQGMVARGPMSPQVQSGLTTQPPAIAPEHRTVIRQPAEHELSPISGQVPRERQENRVIGLSESTEGDESMTEDDMQTEINWVELLSGVDWEEVQTRTKGDPGEFIQWCWLKAVQEQSRGHQMLVELFLYNEPRKIVETLGTGLQRLHEPMAVAFIKLAGKEKDLTTITELLTPLLTTENGVRWLVACRLGALEIAKRIQQDEQGEDDEPTEEDGTDLEASRKAWLDETNAKLGDETVVTIPAHIGQNGRYQPEGEDKLV